MAQSIASIQRKVGELVVQLNSAYQRERTTRRHLLTIHGWKGVVAGTLMSMLGTAAVLEATFGTWIRPTISSLAVAAGILLLFGLRRWSGTFWEMVGLMMMGAWDLIMAAAFFTTFVIYVHDNGLVIRTPWDLRPFPEGQPAAYAIAIYVSLAVMIWGVHLTAVRRERRDEKAHARSRGNR